MKFIDDDKWAALTIWQEARGESQDGKIAVGEVICNRMAARHFSDGTAAGTVLAPYQFSGWNTRDRNRTRCAGLESDDPILLDCIEAWRDARSGTQLTDGAIFYYNPIVVVEEPDWISDCIKTVIIGKHHFFKLK